MITSLELENFKGIGARQRIDFAPLTLLFGANSAGKSTILQALLYLHELLEHGDADVDRTELGGTVIELGGFARLIHQHDLSRTMKIRVTFDTPKDLERFGRDLTYFPFPDLSDNVESAWVELTIRHATWSILERGGMKSSTAPFVEHVSIGTNDVPLPLVELSFDATVNQWQLLHAVVHLEHPQIAIPASRIADDWAQHSSPTGSEDVDAGFAFNAGADALDGATSQYEGEAEDSATPGGPLAFNLIGSRRSALPHYNRPARLVEVDDLDDEQRFAVEDIQAFVEMIVAGTTAQLSEVLRDSLYIGPLRAIPPRGFLYERVGRTTSWADGLAAWDQLLSDRLSLVERTNTWLARLNAACRIVVQQLFDANADAEAITVDHVDATVRRLLLDTGSGSLVLPSEVGAGISQVVPVVVAALTDSRGVTLVEQPELHVHPALQVGLGDLFIEAAMRPDGRGSRKRLMLVETHSEHLILRVLRRIRQTTENELREGDPEFHTEYLSVVYVQKITDGVKIIPMRVDDQGEFLDRWPKGFFGERMEELL